MTTHATGRLRSLCERIDTHLRRRDWLASDTHTNADAYLFVTLRWAQKVGVDLGGLSAVHAFVQRMLDDADVQAALQAEGLA